MSFNLQRILESKRALRQQLAAKPVAEKLRLLDDLRERALSLSGASRHFLAGPIRPLTSGTAPLQRHAG